MNWLNNFNEMIEHILKKENLYSKEIFNKLLVDLSGLKNSGDKYKFIDKIVNKKESKNKIKDVYEIIYNYASEFKKELIEDSISVDKLIIDKIYSRKEISVVANFWNTQMGILWDDFKNVFIAINTKYEYPYHIDKTYIKNLFNEYNELTKEIKYFAYTNGSNSISIFNASPNLKIQNSIGLNNKGYIYSFIKVKENKYKYVGKYIKKELVIEEFIQDGKKYDVMYFSLSRINELNDTRIQEIQKYSEYSDIKSFEKIMDKESINKEEKRILVKTRWNQGIFRDSLIKKYNNNCPLTNIKHNDLLIASHIKPYSKCSREESIDENNGILLSALVDKLFDKGLITFDNHGNIIYSNELCETDLSRINEHIKNNNKINLTSEMNHYMKYHRNNLFKY